MCLVGIWVLVPSVCARPDCPDIAYAIHLANPADSPADPRSANEEPGRNTLRCPPSRCAHNSRSAHNFDATGAFEAPKGRFLTVAQPCCAAGSAVPPRPVSCPSFVFTLRTLSLSSHVRRNPPFFSSRSVLCRDADDPFPPAPRCRSGHHVPSSVVCTSLDTVPVTIPVSVYKPCSSYP